MISDGVDIKVGQLWEFHSQNEGIRIFKILSVTGLNAQIEWDQDGSKCTKPWDFFTRSDIRLQKSKKECPECSETVEIESDDFICASCREKIPSRHRIIITDQGEPKIGHLLISPMSLEFLSADDQSLLKLNREEMPESVIKRLSAFLQA